MRDVPARPGAGQTQVGLRRVRRLAGVALGLVALAVAPAPAHALGGSGSTAALQVALRAHGLYTGDVDGLRGPGTRRAVRAFQRRNGLVADGVVGPRTRRALGRRGRPVVGARAVRAGVSGWDAAAVQFLLARAGFPSGSIDGGFGARSDRALRRFQAFAGLGADGIAGRATLAALRRGAPRSPVRITRPVSAPVGDAFRFRGVRLHAGVDFPAATGAPVVAGAAGTVVAVGWDAGWGRHVIIGHGAGVRTLYAHLSSVAVGAGTRVARGQAVGGVGSTGAATGPHLHFEVFVRGANVDPLAAG